MDLRELLENLEKNGDLINIYQEVDWRLEAAFIDAMNARLNGPKILFNNIKGYPQKRLVTNYLEARDRKRFWSGIARGLGMDPDIEWLPFVQEVSQRLENPIKPLEVSTGPCKENVRIREQVNLFDFPWPYLHEGDGGRFGTLMTWIMKDPDSPWVNWGVYRMQIHSKNKVGIQLQPYTHVGLLYYQKYEPRGMPMPVCIAFGGEPAMLLASVYRARTGEKEVDIAGGLQLEPVPLVKAETNDLLVPANAEVILEGEIRPYERMDEGPFGEMIGFMHGPRVPRPFARINCITFRHNPILPFLTEGLESGSTHSLTSLVTIGRSRNLNLAGAPMVQERQKLGNWMMELIILLQKYPGLSDDVAFQPLSTRPLRCIFDPDDWEPPSDLAGFMEAIFLKAHPTQWKRTDPDMLATKISLMTPEEKKRETRTLAAIDATWPANWSQIPARIRFENSYPRELQQWVVENWEHLGMPGKACLKKPRTR